MNTTMIFAIYCLAAYIIGSIPFGLILAKLFGYGDLRKIGSGNIGATNALRTGNKILAALVLVFDTMKGAFIFIIAALYGIAHFQTGLAHESIFLEPVIKTEFLPFFGLIAVLGHCFPIWLRFKGGKGVATALGVFLAFMPLAGFAACVTWLVSAALFRFSSLAALLAMTIVPAVAFTLYGTASAGMAALISLLIWIRHKDNIRRLLKGEEPKIGKKSNVQPAEATR